MGEVISLSQYRKERIRGASHGNPANAGIQYGLAKPKQAEIDNGHVRQVAEFQRKELDAPDNGPERV